MFIFLSKITIIGIILTIAVISISAAVCIYLASNAQRKEEGSKTEEKKED